MAGEEDNKDEKKTKYRLRLPAKMIDRSQISIWSILKQSIGKDLSKISMPAAFCEPLSFLQRITENVAHCGILNKACDPVYAPDPLKRFEYVCGFAVSNISFNHNRLSKPFNPLLGETYELIREDIGFKIVCEQVCHHPPVSAFHSESIDDGKSWKFFGSIMPKIKFWGKSIEVTPKGIGTLELGKLNETYTWHAVTCCIHNIIVGKLWFEYYGTMEVNCKQTGYRAIINFKPYSWSNKELNKVEGFIYDKKKNKVKALYGYWTHCLYSCDPDKYEEYSKLDKPLPMVHVDEFFNEINNQTNGSTIKKNNHSASSLLDQNNCNNNNNNKTKFTVGSDNDNTSEKSQLIDDTQEKLNLNNSNNRISSTNYNNHVSPSAVSLPVNSTYDLTEVFEIWRAPSLPPYTNDYYNFNYFTMCLNEFKDDFKDKLAPTDARFRQDIRQLELGNLDGAGDDKNRLEEKQREVRRTRKDEYKPKWFYQAKHPQTQEETWIFNNKYWLRNFSDCPDIY